MPAKDIDFMDVDSDSDISLLAEETSRSKAKGKGKAVAKAKKAKGKNKANDVSSGWLDTVFYLRICILQQAYTWEASYTRSWDTVQEDEGGNLQGAVEDWMARGRRRRYV
jgi:transcription initiation factor TFIIH subunit 2